MFSAPVMSTENEESLREAACVGNLEEIDKLLALGTNLNSVNTVNGWSPLHWAAKRGHATAVTKLLNAGADKTIQTIKGEIAADLTSKNQIRNLLGAPLLESGGNVNLKSSSDFKPNYLANPDFIYTNSKHLDTSEPEPIQPLQNLSNRFHFQPQNVTLTSGNQWSPAGLTIHPDFLVLCVRLAVMNSGNRDFSEVEINRNEAPSLTQLTEILCKHTGIKLDQVQKIRKLPNTVLKNDRDVLRLTDYQALEIVLLPHVRHPIDGAVSSANYGEQADTKYLKEYASKLIY